jgi:hypothetical protein
MPNPWGKSIRSGSTKHLVVHQIDRALDPDKSGGPANLFHKLKHSDLVHGLDMQTLPGLIFKTHLLGSKAGGELIHKLVRVAQSIQVPWQTQVMSASCNTSNTLGLAVLTLAAPRIID